MLSCAAVGPRPQGQEPTGPGGETAQGRRPRVWAVPPGAKEDRADRIAEQMSYQLLELTPNWEDDTDKLRHLVPFAG